ncbi:hypothetical protein ANN_02520 [Periplaneta americana]|uniref:Uncharacterized protein n=1 Tax=Periplaneta americana TaxID=6978 RepID=A0ABQ8TZG7_PERAM|nr:hypothetical protein ANN_02520 [Periplaneta americana]
MARLCEGGNEPPGSLKAKNHNLSQTELVCTRSWLLDGCQPTLSSVDIEEKLDRCRVEFPVAQLVERLYVKPKVPGDVLSIAARLHL